MILSLLRDLVIAMGIFFVAIIAHELSHYYTAKRLGYNARIEKGSYVISWVTIVSGFMTVRDEKNFLEAGMLGGFLIICLNLLLSPAWFIPSIILYGFGISSDAKRYLELRKR